MPLIQAHFTLMDLHDILVDVLVEGISEGITFTLINSKVNMNKELAKKLKINVNISPWMFNYEGLGWGYQPTTQEQWNFFEDNLMDYPDNDYMDWIIKFCEFSK